jgi:hypothetical protein
LLENKCSPHIFLIFVKLSACHICPPRFSPRRTAIWGLFLSTFCSPLAQFKPGTPERQEANPTERRELVIARMGNIPNRPRRPRRPEKRQCISRTLGASFGEGVDQFIVLSARHRLVCHCRLLVTLFSCAVQGCNCSSKLTPR